MVNYKTPKYIGDGLFIKAYSSLNDVAITEDEKFLFCDMICSLKNLQPSLSEEKLINKVQSLVSIKPLNDDFSKLNRGANGLCHTYSREILISPTLDENRKLTTLLHEGIHLLGHPDGTQGLEAGSKYLNEIIVQRISWDISQDLGIPNTYVSHQPDISIKGYGVGYGSINSVSETIYDVFGEKEVYESLLGDKELEMDEYKRDFLVLAERKMRKAVESETNIAKCETMDVAGIKFKALPAIMEEKKWDVNDYLNLSRKYSQESPYFLIDGKGFYPSKDLIANDALFLAKINGIDSRLITREFDTETQSEEMVAMSAALSMLRESGAGPFSAEEFKDAQFCFEFINDKEMNIGLRIGNIELKNRANIDYMQGQGVISLSTADFEIDSSRLQPLLPPQSMDIVKNVSHDMVASDTVIYHKYMGGLNNDAKEFLKVFSQSEYVSRLDIMSIGQENFEKYLQMGFADTCFKDQKNFNFMSSLRFPDGKSILEVACSATPNTKAFNNLIELGKSGIFPEGVNPLLRNSETGQLFLDALLAEMKGKDSKECHEIYKAIHTMIERGGSFSNKSAALIKAYGNLETVCLASKHLVPLHEMLGGAALDDGVRSSLKVFIQGDEPIAYGYLGGNGRYDIVHRLSLPPDDPRTIPDILELAQACGGEVINVKTGLLSGSYEINGETFKCGRQGLQPKEIYTVLEDTWSKDIMRSLSQKPDFMIKSSDRCYLMGMDSDGQISFRREVPDFVEKHFDIPCWQYDRNIELIAYDKNMMKFLKDSVNQKAAEI